RPIRLICFAKVEGRVRFLDVTAPESDKNQRSATATVCEACQKRRRATRVAQPMIGTEEIAWLAALYDRYANAFERTSPDRAQARRQFEAFRLEVVTLCKDFIKRN